MAYDQNSRLNNVYQNLCQYVCLMIVKHQSSLPLYSLSMLAKYFSLIEFTLNKPIIIEIKVQAKTGIVILNQVIRRGSFFTKFNGEIGC